MKRALIKIGLAYLLLWIAVPSDLLFQLVTFPALLAHYSHHDQHHPEENLLNFLAEHLNGSGHHDDHPHPDFPCDHQHNNHCFQIQHWTDEVPHLTISPRIIDLNDADPMKKYLFKEQTALSGIWQPPRV